MDIKQVAQDAHPHLYSLVSAWLQGSLRGKNFQALDPTYEDTKLGSFQINVETGVWKNFANGQGGNDAVSLYAYINKMGMKESAEEVAKQIGAPTFTPKELPKKTGQTWVVKQCGTNNGSQSVSHQGCFFRPFSPNPDIGTHSVCNPIEGV